MANNERYITTVELNSQQAMDRLKELEQKVKDLKKAKEDAAKSGGFFDEASLKKATKELNQWRAQMQGVQGILDNINDVTLEDLQKGLRKLKAQSKTALPGTQEFTDIQQGIIKIEDRIKELRNSTREAKSESEQLTMNMEHLVKVMQNVKGASLNDLLSAQKILEQNVANAKPGTTSYDTANAQLKEVKARIQEIRGEQQQIVHQIDKYDQEIKMASKDMATMERETDLVEKTMRNLSKANMRDLEYSIKIVNEQLREMPRGTKEFERMQERAKLLRTELERVRFEGAAQQSWLNRTADFFNKIQGAAIAAIGAVTGLSFTIRRCVEAFASMDQEMENVRKYTGQTSEQVHEMNEEFKQLDTRTSRERLNQLAGDAGRLGIQGKEAIMEFVDAADKINVALGDDLGEDAVKNVGKLAMSFGTDKTMGLRGAMLATSSAVNELSQNSSASAGYLVDFTARVAGFGKQVGLAQTQIMGFGAVMDENMLRDEMAATAFGQLLVKMTTDIDTFARITGMKAEEFKKLVTEDINGAILAVAKSLKGRDMQDLGKVFDAMNLDGQRAISVLATLGDKVDDVVERQKIANDAFEEGTSIINEFNVQNETVQAQLEKQKKQFADLTVELGEKLMPIARYTISTGAMLVKAIMALIEFVGKYRTTITTLTVAITALIVKKELDIALTKLQVFWTDKLAAAIKRLYLLVVKNPWTATAVAVAAVVAWIADLTRKSREAVTVTEKLNKMRGEAAKKYGEEKAKLDLLLATAKNEKATLDNRRKAIDKLNQIIPNYNAQLDITTGKYKDNEEALRKYNEQLARKFELEGAGEMLREIGSKVAKAQVEITQLQQQLKEADEDEANLSMSTGGVYGRTKSDEIRENLAEQNEIIRQAGKERRAIYESYPELTGSTNGETLEDRANRHLKQIVDSHKNESPQPSEFNDPKADEKAKKAAEAAAKKEAAKKLAELKALDKAEVAETENKLATNLSLYAQGNRDYRTYVAEMDRITLEGYENRLKIWSEDSDQYKKILNDKEQYNLKAVERQERLSQKEVEIAHQSRLAILQSMQWDDEGEFMEAMHQEDINYLQEKAALYRKGSEERVEIEQEIQEREFQHQLDRQQRYEEMVEELKENYLNMGNERLKNIALNGLKELYNDERKLISEEEYKKAKIAIQAQYASHLSPDEQVTQLGSQMLTNARDKVNENAQKEGTSFSMPIVGTIQQYQATMEQLKELYANDEANHAAYLVAKQQATAEFCQQLSSQFQAAYSSANQIMSAANSLYSAQADYETAVVKKKYEKQIAAAGNNQKKVKKLQEKQQKEEAAIKNKYNKKQVKIQIAQAIAQTAMNALNAYGSVVGIPIVGPALAVVAAAAAVAAGMIQIAAIKKQAQAQEEGYYSGGFTGGKRYRKEAGVVHEGEFVANHQAVNNPAVRPMLDFIDQAQRNNTIGALTADDISRQLGQGGSAVVAPIVNVQTDNEDLREELQMSREVNEHLLTVIEEKGIKVDFPLDTFDRKYNHFKRLNER